ncbi:MAG: monovalent cation/H+ antiporter complex subunit F [Chloroflexota bacterium]
MSDPLINMGVQLGLVVLVVLYVISTYRIWRGPSPADRLQAADASSTLLIGIIIVLAVVQGTPALVDVGIALAALGFVGTLAVARYLAEGKVF